MAVHKKPIIRAMRYVMPALLLLLGIGAWYERELSRSEGIIPSDSYEHMQEEVNQTEFEAVKLLQSDKLDTMNWLKNWNDIQELAQQNQVILYLYRNDTLMLWSGNSMSVVPRTFELKQGSQFLQVQNGNYLVYYQRKGSYGFLIAKLINYTYVYRNQFIQNTFHPRFRFINEALIQPDSSTGFLPIHSINGTTLFFISIQAIPSHIPDYFKWIYIALIVLFIALMHVALRYTIVKNTLRTSLFFGIFWFVIRYINHTYLLPGFIYETRLFNPFIYASSTWFPSLGDLIVDSLLVLWWFSLYEHAHQYISRHPKSYKSPQAMYLWLIASVLLTHITVLSIRSLTLDSQISFDVTNIFNISFYTYLAIFVIIVQLLVVYFAIRKLYLVSITRSGAIFKHVLLIALALGMYLIVSTYSLWISWFQALLTIVIAISFLLYRYVSIRFNRFQHYFGLVFFISLFTAAGIQYWSEKKEQEERKLFAIRLTSQNDITTDYFLRTIEKRIKSDSYIQNYFYSPFISKALFEKRIRQIYFTGYLSRYEVNVLDYDAYGNHFKQRNAYSYQVIRNIYQQESNASIHSHFRYISTNTMAKSYLGQFEITDGSLVIGRLFILLKPKLIQNENRFDKLLIEGYRSASDKPYQYSYALYKDKSLVYQSGSYPYRITNTWGEALDSFLFVADDGYEHLLHTDNQSLTVMVSKPSTRWVQAAGLFSFIFTLCTSVLVLILFVYVLLNAQTLHRYHHLLQWLIKPLRKTFNTLLLIKPQEALYLRTRIQTSIIFILFISLLVSAYLTISFITQKYNQRQNERLMKKLRSVVLTIENENINRYEGYESNELEAFINELADLYDNDITLFDVNGKMLASSITKIYDAHIISRDMPPDAYFHLRHLKESQFTHTESVGNLSFQSAYAPVFYDKDKLLGYVHLPYFSQQADLNTEISSVVIGFINLYVVLFIFIGIIAYIITRNIAQPLALIQQRLSGTRLLQNEPIDWSSKDEIGELVNQYNHMIKQLEDSAKKLAENEREGAWREIARQIAHEIKNPLTPMKLSIQHLQRAYSNKDANIEEKLNRTAQLLVKQIDILSDLAGEFSSFAKMPNPVYEWLNVDSELSKLVTLYQTESHITINLTCHVESELYFDSSYFHRSIGNLIKNAIQSVPEEQPVHIEIHAVEYTESIEISVKDNGHGIDEDKATDIFKPYFSTKINGMGLGLPLVKNMIENGKGSIWFTSQKGVGTTFFVRLPKHTK